MAECVFVSDLSPRSSLPDPRGGVSWGDRAWHGMEARARERSATARLGRALFSFSCVLRGRGRCAEFADIRMNLLPPSEES
jgi:hypothetical protein